jgi:hypothetical protein
VHHGVPSRRRGDEHAHDELPPEQERLAGLRDEIAGMDGQILYLERENAEVSAALGEVANLDGRKMTKALTERGVAIEEGRPGRRGAARADVHQHRRAAIADHRVPGLSGRHPVGESLLAALRVIQMEADEADQADAWSHP